MSWATPPPSPPLAEAGVVEQEGPPRECLRTWPVGWSPLCTTARRSASRESQCANLSRRPTGEGSFVRSLSWRSRATRLEKHRSALLEIDEQAALSSQQVLLGLDRRGAWDGEALVLRSYFSCSTTCLTYIPPA